MITYTYKCPNCGKFERLERITDSRLELCPNCNKQVKLIIQKTDFILKGEGWFKK